MVALATRQVRVPAVLRSRAAVGTAALAALGLLLVPRFAAPGWEMDEGAILAYGDRLLHGELPLRDLHSFYGPLGSFLVAGVFKVVGPSLAAERAIGLVYRLVLAGALLALVRRQGGVGVVAAALALALFLPMQGVAAFATYGALAAAAGALLCADLRRPLAAGLCAAVALLLRFDFALPLALASLPFLVAWPWRARLRLVGGACAAAVLYAAYVAAAGLSRLRLMLEQLRSGQSGRHLPVSVWPDHRGYILDLMLLAVAVLVVVGVRRRGDDRRLFLAVALLAVGLLPYVLVRADRSHMLVGAIVPVAVAASLLGRFRMLAPAAVLVVLAIPAVRGNYEPLLALDVVSAADESSVSYVVQHGGRSFRVDSAVEAQNAQRAVDRADALAPANGSLFVGPGDLGAPSYSDAYIYFLLPRLRPATFYITLDPTAVDERGARLADELPRADVLILNTAYGSGVNAVVERDFCARGAYGTFHVYARC